jgi:hypothetical protein
MTWLILAAILIGASGVIFPLLPMFFPRLGLGLLYAIRTIRVVTIELSLLLGIVTVALFSDTRAYYGFGLILLIAVLAQMLYPHKIISAVDEPEHVSIEAAAQSGRLPPHLLVIGLAQTEAACAWPVDLLLAHQVVNDHLAGQAVMVSYCAACRAGRIYSAEHRGQALTFEVAGFYRRNLLLRDRQTGSLWQQATGEAVYGALAGARLPALDGQPQSWASWLAEHADTQLAVQWFTKRSWAPAGLVGLALSGFPRHTALAGLTDLGLDLPGEAEVVGISRAGETKAYPLAVLEKMGVINDRLGGAALAVWADRSSGQVGAFERQADGTEICLAFHNGILQSEGSVARWDLAGQSLSGGEPLQRVAALRLWWQGWKEFHPRSEVYRDGGSD